MSDQKETIKERMDRVQREQENRTPEQKESDRKRYEKMLDENFDQIRRNGY